LHYSSKLREHDDTLVFHCISPFRNIAAAIDDIDLIINSGSWGGSGSLNSCLSLFRDKKIPSTDSDTLV
jgi:hypothetical protein